MYKYIYIYGGVYFVCLLKTEHQDTFWTILKKIKNWTKVAPKDL